MPQPTRWLFLWLLLIGVALFLAYGTLHYWLVELPYQATIDKALSNHAQEYAGRLDSEIDKVISQVTEISTQPGTLAILKLPHPNDDSKWLEGGNSPEARARIQKWYTTNLASIPGARALYLLEKDSANSPFAGDYVAERLAARAAGGESPPPMATMTNEWRIYIARPLAYADQVGGAIVVDIDPQSIAERIINASTIKGRAALVQTIPGFPPTEVFSLGAGWKEQHSIILPISVANWDLKFTGNRDLLTGIHPSAALFYAVYTCLTALAIALAYFLIRRQASAVQSELPASNRHRQKIAAEDDFFIDRHYRNKGQKDKPPSPSPLASPTSNGESGMAPKEPLPIHVFRDYDIRGKAFEEITESFARLLGQVLGSRVIRHKGDCLVVCSDGRTTSPALKQALMDGITSTGCNVIHLGEAPTPVMNFALATLDNCHSGVMVTASHNPKGDNGFKIILNGHTLSSDEIHELRSEMDSARFRSGAGSVKEMDLITPYIEAVGEDILPVSQVNIVVDCGNGIGGKVAQPLLERLGCRVTGLFTEVDGEFPNHPPDPLVPANLEPLRNAVTENNADLGIALDGDGDRVVAISSSGKIVWPDELMMIFAKDVITRNPGADIIFDVKSTRRLRELISNYGGRPVMWKTGHANIRNKVAQTGSPLGGEYSGHIFFNDRWHGFDDGLYAAARLLEIMTLREQGLDDILKSLPLSFHTPEIKIPVDEDEKYHIVDNFKRHGNFEGAQVVTIDGVRLEFDSGWGLVRASNTSAAITLRFEADTEAALETIKTKVKEQLQRLEPQLNLDSL